MKQRTPKQSSPLSKQRRVASASESEDSDADGRSPPRHRGGRSGGFVFGILQSCYEQLGAAELISSLWASVKNWISPASRKGDRRLRRGVKRGHDDEDEDEKRFNWARTFVVGAFLLLLFGGGFQLVLSVYESLAGGYRYVDVKGPMGSDNLKEIFFSGAPYLVYCSYVGTAAQKVTPLLLNSRHELAALGVNLRSLDCSAKMASGRSAIERFKLPTNVVAVVVANRENPTPLTPSSLRTRNSLLDFVRKAIRPKVRSIDKIGDLNSFCIQQQRCVIYARTGTTSTAVRNELLPNAITKSKHGRGVKVVTLDTKRFRLALDEKLAGTRPSEAEADRERKSLLCLIPATSSSSPYGVFHSGAIDTVSSISVFLSQCNAAPVPPPEAGPFVQLGDNPKLYNRPAAASSTPTPSPSQTPDRHKPSSQTTGTRSAPRTVKRSEDNGGQRYMAEEDDAAEDVEEFELS